MSAFAPASTTAEAAPAPGAAARPAVIAHAGQSAGPNLINPAATCGAAAGQLPTDRLRVVGRRLKDSAGHVIIPEGISIVGGPEQRQYMAARAATNAQIKAAADAWHINSQRLQVSEGNLMHRPTRGYGYNRKFANYLNQMICQILSDHEIPIINDNTWFTGNQPDPTATTVRFWNYMSLNYGRWPVMFDLFNEPRLKHDAQGHVLSDARVWQLWKWGGWVSGVHYVGMQQLVNDIRDKDHAGNVIWIESAYETSHTRDLPGHFIKGHNLMYSFHKLRLDDPSAWRAVGRLAQRGIALVDGEWTEFAALNRPWECYSNAYTSAPAYLAYWKRLGVGFEAWSLQYGALVKGPAGQSAHDGNYLGLPTDPTVLEVPSQMESSYGCNQRSLGQGAGTLVMRYFKHTTRGLPAALFQR